MTSGTPPTEKTGRSALKKIQKNMLLRFALVILTIILTAILLFSLTVAWFTNVVQTGGLMLTAEAWNFDGTITVSEEAVTAAPGDSGFIPLQMENNGQGIVLAGLTVSKDQMDEDLRKRVYFCVDIPAVRHGERVEQIWIGKNSSYTYTLFPGSALSLGEDDIGAPRLKWMWVYDVLGYYVIGTRQGETIEVSEYLRPIEYDYDEAKTTFDVDADGEITSVATIDGVTALEFLQAVSQTDGYEGALEDGVQPIAGYYPIQVDENGQGVWAYLCTYSEILQNRLIDADLGNSESPASGTARITLSGWNSREQVEEIGSEAALLKALERSDAAMVKLSDDISLSTQLMIPSGKQLWVDLDGHTVNLPASQNAMKIETGGELTLTNGRIAGNTNRTAFVSYGGRITLQDVEVTNVKTGFELFDADLTPDDLTSVIRLTDSTISARNYGVWIIGTIDNTIANRNIVISIENCTIEGTEHTGVLGNGTVSGSDIRIDNSAISGRYAGIYQPAEDSKLTVADSTVSGWTGIAIKGGTAILIDSVISGTGAHTPPKYDKSGYTDTGDGVYLDASYAWDTSIIIAGEKTKISSAHAQAVRLFDDEGTLTKGAKYEIIISGGTFSSDVSAYLAEGATITQNGQNYVVSMPS